MGETIDNTKPTTIFKTIRVLVTPKMAKELLEHNSRNRPLTPPRVYELAKLMKEGLFQCTHQGIALDDNMDVLDGQHRLAAVVKSGCSVYMMVSKGVPDESRLVVDIGKSRTPLAIARITGRDKDSVAMYSIARLLQFGPVKYSQMYVQPQILFRLVDKYSESINFVLLYGKGIPVSILAVVARAYYSKDKNRLKEFLMAYKTSITTGDKDLSAVKLRIFVGERRKTSHAGGQKYALTKKYLYQVAESAVTDFLNYYPTNQLMPTKKEKFPLPAELDGWNSSNIF